MKKVINVFVGIVLALIIVMGLTYTGCKIWYFGTCTETSYAIGWNEEEERLRIDGAIIYDSTTGNYIDYVDLVDG